MTRRVVHVIGPVAAGKSTVAAAIGRRSGAPVVAFDDVLARCLPAAWDPELYPHAYQAEIARARDAFREAIAAVPAAIVETYTGAPAVVRLLGQCDRLTVLVTASANVLTERLAARDDRHRGAGPYAPSPWDLTCDTSAGYPDPLSVVDRAAAFLR